ncbi:hypothetical protein A2U01_0086346, partial [Trifolium medium]|nr:hypothetical protein [Trifolium medium]
QEREAQTQPQPQTQPQVGKPQTQAEMPTSDAEPVQEQLLSQEVPNIDKTSGHINKV